MEIPQLVCHNFDIISSDWYVAVTSSKGFTHQESIPFTKSIVPQAEWYGMFYSEASLTPWSVDCCYAKGSFALHGYMYYDCCYVMDPFIDLDIMFFPRRALCLTLYYVSYSEGSVTWFRFYYFIRKISLPDWTLCFCPEGFVTWFGYYIFVRKVPTGINVMSITIPTWRRENW